VVSSRFVFGFLAIIGGNLWQLEDDEGEKPTGENVVGRW
jgi:hypothetical protein